MTSANDMYGFCVIYINERGEIKNIHVTAHDEDDAKEKAWEESDTASDYIVNILAVDLSMN